jgi:hypothetical protein
MKTNCWFNRKISPRPAVAGLLIPLLLACFALLISVTTPAEAGDHVPFNGTVSGQIPPAGTPLDGCHIAYHVVNFGNATELGVFTGTAEFIVDFCTGPNFMYTAPTIGLRPTAAKSPALSPLNCLRFRERRAYTITLKPPP